GSPQREQERDDDYHETAHRTLLAGQYRPGHRRLLRPGNRPPARSSEGTVPSRPGSEPSLLPSVSIVTNPRAAVGTVSVDSAPRALRRRGAREIHAGEGDLMREHVGK